MICILVILVWSLEARYVAAQSWTAQPTWRKPNITTPQNDRIQLARQALESGYEMLTNNGQFEGMPYRTPPIFYANMAEFDFLTNQTIYKEKLRKLFREANRINSNFLNTELAYGYAAARAYSIYKDTEFAQYAQTVWNSGRRYTLSKDDVSSRQSPVKNASLVLQSECSGVTLAGGTFWSKDENAPEIFSTATEFFLLISAHLAEATKNDTYLQAALESAQFMQHHLYDWRNNVQTWTRATNCEPWDGPTCGDAGWMIEALAVLASLTGEQSVEKQLEDTISAAITNQRWHDLDGIISVGYQGLPLVRGLSVAYSRTLLQPDIRQYIVDYLGVQYNAVLDNAKKGGSNTYSGVWNGTMSADTTVTGETQAGAIAVLLGAVSLPQKGLQQNPAPDVPLNTTKNPNTAAIVGGVIGGLGLVTLAIIAFLWMRRRRGKAVGGHTFQEPISGFENQVAGLNMPPTPIHEKSRPRVRASPRSTERSYLVTQSAPESAGDNLGSISTEMLARELNNRLQTQQWRPGEHPPGYTENPSTTS
ncbi:glycoside hydrolase family 76 protein [Moniliophthora roreri MCA 2997]|uniref:Glycoside hydrolase family 76 protein n=1 Tax=Moniliophthora roreri (strain MCA 2997) TaxID=1381753 RepID=V2WSR1_MONRO|nr:glycoside hydrolase family 76 protein [Moniliophthora roreri MCA 2997]